MTTSVWPSVGPIVYAARVTPDSSSATPKFRQSRAWKRFDIYRETPEVRRQLDFMRAAFDSGTPSFGSCVGLSYATLIEALGRDPGRRDLVWLLGVDAQVSEPTLRQTEVRNVIEHLVRSIRSHQNRG